MLLIDNEELPSKIGTKDPDFFAVILMTTQTLPSKISVRLLLPVCLTLILGLTSCGPRGEEAPVPTFIESSVSAVQELSPPAYLDEDNSLSFDHITLEHGLSQSTINSIVQDDQGYMWFGTNNGLNRYDGYEIKVFRHDPSDPETIADNIIQGLFVDDSGTLWVGTEGNGLDRYNRDQETFHHFAHNPDDPSTIGSDFVYTFLQDRSGTLWIGLLNGLNKFNPESGTFTRYVNDQVDVFDADGANFVLSIYEDPSGILWLGTASGLFSFDPSAEEFGSRPLPLRYSSNPVSSFLEDRDGDLWIGTFNDGVYQYNPQSDRVTLHRHSPVKLDSISDNTVRAVAEDDGGNIWLATDGGLNRRGPGSTGWTHYQHDPQKPDSLSDDITPSLFIDESDILWSGTFTGGLNKFDPYKAKFKHVKSDPEDPEHGLSSNLVIAFLEDSEGFFWFGTFEGLDKVDQNSNEVEHYTSRQGDPRTIAFNIVVDLLEDHSGNVWVGTQGGLSRYNRQNNNFTSYRNNPNDSGSLAFPVIQDLYEDNRGQLWIATAREGFDRYDPETDTFIHHQFDDEERLDNVGPDSIRKFLEDSAGQFWIGTMGGLGKFDRDTGEIIYYTHDPEDPESISNDYVLSLHEDSGGTLWVGTQIGLNRFVPDSETFVRYLPKDGLPDNLIYGMLEDDDGNLWISTNHGISKFNIASETFHNFDTGDGLQALEFNVNAYYEASDGEMYFGGINGYNHFYPEDIIDNPYGPPIIITGLEIENEEVSFGDGERIDKPISQTEFIQLDRGDSSIVFELAALHFSSPENNLYAYILEGFDEQWNYIGSRRHAQYTNLPPGEYTFKAIGTNSDGIWNTDGASIELSMPFPFWRTWWFLFLVGFLLIAFAYTAYRIRTNAMEARTRELEHQVISRTSEIARRREIAEGLREILIILNSSQSLEESLHYIVDQAARLTDAEDTIIFRKEDPARMAIVATNPGGQIRYTPGPGLLAIASPWLAEGLPEHQPLIMPDLENYWRQHPDSGPDDLSIHKAILGVPLHLGDEIYGGLLMFYTARRAFTQDDLELGSTFADQAALAIANDRLREQAEETAVATERNRLARDLHDAVTQTLFSASLIAETLPIIYESDHQQGLNLLQELRQLTRGALAEMRTLLLELRPLALEESELPDLLLQLCEAVTGRTGVPISAAIEKPCPLPATVRIALYRIAQETLNNVMKHARATEVSLNLQGCGHGEILVLTIVDNGRGFDLDQVPPDRMGLSIIGERAQAIGADLEMKSQPQEGTSVTVRWPGNSISATAADED